MGGSGLKIGYAPLVQQQQRQHEDQAGGPPARYLQVTAWYLLHALLVASFLARRGHRLKTSATSMTKETVPGTTPKAALLFPACLSQRKGESSPRQLPR